MPVKSRAWGMDPAEMISAQDAHRQVLSGNAIETVDHHVIRHESACPVFLMAKDSGFPKSWTWLPVVHDAAHLQIDTIFELFAGFEKW